MINSRKKKLQKSGTEEGYSSDGMLQRSPMTDYKVKRVRPNPSSNSPTGWLHSPGGQAIVTLKTIVLAFNYRPLVKVPQEVVYLIFG